MFTHAILAIVFLSHVSAALAPSFFLLCGSAPSARRESEERVTG